jgi:hypothetical protein
LSGRVISGYREDGTAIVGYRKTNRRRRPARPLLERLYELNQRQARRHPTRWCPEVRVGFLLPKHLQGFIASGQHGFGVNVHRGFVQITHGSADQCFGQAREFFATVAKERPAFTVTASVISSSQPGRNYGRHLTIVRGALVVSAGYAEPKVYEAA